jgi:DNA-binding LytR/AlgR family response regulator
LAECEERLRDQRFLRVHRAYLVNLDHVIEVSPSFGGTYVLRTDDRRNSEVPVSRSYVKAMRSALGV